MIDRERIFEAHGATVVDNDGDKIGTVTDVYLDKDTGEPEWIVVRTGLFGMRSTFIPLRDAKLVGNDIQVPYDKEKVKGAPNVDKDEELSPDEERRLYEYYGHKHPGPPTGETSGAETHAAGAAGTTTAAGAGPETRTAGPQVRLVRYVVITRR